MADFSDILKQVRENDEQSEVQKNKENESLHPSRIQKYLEDNDITADNFNEKFNFDSALAILRMKNTRGEALMEQELVSTKEYLDGLQEDGAKMMSDFDNDTFSSDLNRLLTKHNALDHEKSINIAHQKYLAIRTLAYRRVQILGKFESRRQEEKVDATAGLKEGFADKWEEVKKNYRKMSRGEKAVAVGALVIGTIWLFSQSDNPKIQKAKDYAWKGLKLAGAGVGINYAWKLFSGETLVTDLDNWASSTAGSEGFWKESFKTDEKEAEIMQRSFVYMNDKDVLDLSRRYRAARASKLEKIDLPDVAKSDMKPEEVYIALDTFFKRYPVDKIEQRFKNEQPDQRKWANVTATLLGEDGRLEMEGDMLDEAYEGVRYAWNNSINFVAGGTWDPLKKSYKRWRGEAVELSPEDFKEWFKKFFDHKVPSAANLPEHVRKESRAKSAPHLVNVIEHGQIEGNVQHLKGDDAHYTMVTVALDDLEKDKTAAGVAWNKAMKRLEQFYGEQYSAHKDKINKFIVPETAACVVDERKFVFFARMPLPNSAEFQAIEFGKRTNLDMMNDKDIETFEGKMTFDKLQKWEQDQFRILYGLDSTQIGADTDKIFAEITRKYEALAVPILKMKQDVLTDESLRDEILKKAGVEPKLEVNKVLLGTVTDHEKVAASQIEGASHLYHETQAELRRVLGYTIRLAILGDPKAREKIKYDPNKSFWTIIPDISWTSASWTKTGLEDLLRKYKEFCLKYVALKNQGRNPKQLEVE